MGVDLNWDMLTSSSANFGNALARVGQAIGEGRQKRKAANVLAQYASNPDPQTMDEGRLNELAKYYPDLLLQATQQRRAQEQQAGNVQLVHNAQGGDAGALDQLAVKLPEIWKSMSAEHRTEAAQHSKVFANFALGADTPEKWDAGIDLLSQQYPDAAQYKGRFDPNLRSSLVAQGEMTQQLYEQTKPQWMAPQPGGAIVNVRDPQAIADYNHLVNNGAPAPAPSPVPTPPKAARGDLVPDAASIVQQVYPGVHVTDGRRDPNSALGRANPGSYHNMSDRAPAVDVRPIPGMTFDQYIKGLRERGYEIVEKRDEATHPLPHTTGPNWHVVLGARRKAPPPPSGFVID